VPLAVGVATEDVFARELRAAELRREACLRDRVETVLAGILGVALEGETVVAVEVASG